MLVALVEEKRNSDVLHVPSVLVNNNSVARVSTLDEQPTTQITATGGGVGAGQTQENFNDYVEAGITMEISPSISASRYLRLDVYLEVSTFIGAVQGAIRRLGDADDPDSDQRPRWLHDGHRRHRGGQREQDRIQVPWLGDIPILGRLFSRETEPGTAPSSTSSSPTHPEGHRVRRPCGALVQEEARGRPRDGIDRLRKIDPTFGMSSEAAGSSVGLEGFDLPLYTPPQRGETAGDQVGLSPLEAARMLDEETPED